MCVIIDTQLIDRLGIGETVKISGVMISGGGDGGGGEKTQSGAIFSRRRRTEIDEMGLVRCSLIGSNCCLESPAP